MNRIFGLKKEVLLSLALVLCMGILVLPGTLKLAWFGLVLGVAVGKHVINHLGGQYDHYVGGRGA